MVMENGAIAEYALGGKSRDGNAFWALASFRPGWSAALAPPYWADRNYCTIKLPVIIVGCTSQRKK
jgi:hypothetical protein